MSLKINEEYFSGAQASIMIGDIWVDDIMSISFSDTYSAQPIFGYGSTFFDHISEGREMIQGSFTINFREPNYLWIILSAYSDAYDIKEYDGNKEGTFQRNKAEAYSPLNQSATMSQTRQDLLSFMNSGDAEKVGRKIREKKTLTNTLLDKKALSSDFNAKTFDIVIGYGDDLDSNSPGERLVSCKIVGKSRTIMANGEAIKETYNFFARKQE